jgi:dihydrofolate reductase
MVQALMAADLVDELLLTVEPIVLGGGKSLFANNGEAFGWELLSSKTAKTGAIVNHYKRAR